MVEFITDPITGASVPIIADTLILGGGIAGITAADELAANDVTSALFEQRSELMLGASGINPGRAGLGFHYADATTAYLYLKATIYFIRKYMEEAGIDFRLGADKYVEDHPMRRGRYFIPNDSLVPAHKLIQVYQAIGEQYKKLVQDDPRNMIFGDPQNFHEMLSVKSYRDDVSFENITLAIETREQLIDVPRFRSYLVKKILNNRKIKTFTNTKVLSIDRTHDAQYYIVTFVRDGKVEKAAARRLINASWESTDKLNQTMQIPMENPGYELLLVTGLTDDKVKELSEKHAAPVIVRDSEGKYKIYGNTDGKTWKFTSLNASTFEHVPFPLTSQGFRKYPANSAPVYVREEIKRTGAHTSSPFRTNRVKILAEVKLPDSLKDKPCMFFAIGPFCMFSNMQDGRGLITYAPKTNFIQSKAVSLTDSEESRLHTGFTAEETQRLGQEIIDGVSQFIPEMKNSQLIGIRGGVVKTYGDVDLCDPNSDFHKRRELGIQELALGALEISSMKLLYGIENAEQARALFQVFDKVESDIVHLSDSLANDFSTAQPSASTNKPVCLFFNAHFRRYSSTHEIQKSKNEVESRTTTCIHAKAAVVEEIKRNILKK